MTLWLRVFASSHLSDEAIATKTKDAIRFYAEHGMELKIAKRLPLDVGTVFMAGDSPQVALRPATHHMANQPPFDGVDVVFVPRMATENASLWKQFTDLQGYTIGPGHPVFHQGQTPTVFILSGHQTRPGAKPTLLAHEIGHAVGLEHTKNPRNLMFSGVHGFWPTLSDEQLDWLRTAMD